PPSRSATSGAISVKRTCTTSLSPITARTRRRACRSPRLANVMRRSASGRRRLALVSVVLIDLCVNSAAARFASSRRSWAGPPPRRGPLVGLGILSYSRSDSGGRNSDGLVVVAAVEVRAVEPGNRVLERQSERDELVAHLVDRLLTEVADVHELRLREGDELADRVDALTLEAVVRTDRQIEVFDRHRQLVGEDCLDRRGADLDALGLDVQLARQTEQLGQGAAGRRDGVARGDGCLGLDVQDQLVEVGAFPGTGGVDAVADLEDRRVDRVDGDLTRLGVLVAVLRGRHVAAATLDRELELELGGVVQGRDDQLGVVDLDTGRSRDVSGGD